MILKMIAFPILFAIFLIAFAHSVPVEPEDGQGGQKEASAEDASVVKQEDEAAPNANIRDLRRAPQKADEVKNIGKNFV